MLLNDIAIREYAARGMITPFEPLSVSKICGTQVKAMSYGASSFGYDLRLSDNEFRIFRRKPGTIVDPKAFDSETLEEVPLQGDKSGDYFVLPALSYGLGVALEHLSMPKNILGVCLGKSSYARCGIIANTTPAEPGWSGHLTLEFSNSSNADCRIYAWEGVVQMLFFEGQQCDIDYAKRNGKYQDQPESIILPR
jgi:dCTP deaminase